MQHSFFWYEQLATCADAFCVARPNRLSLLEPFCSCLLRASPSPCSPLPASSFVLVVSASFTPQHGFLRPKSSRFSQVAWPTDNTVVQMKKTFPGPPRGSQWWRMEGRAASIRAHRRGRTGRAMQVFHRKRTGMARQSIRGETQVAPAPADTIPAELDIQKNGATA